MSNSDFKSVDMHPERMYVNADALLDEIRSLVGDMTNITVTATFESDPHGGFGYSVISFSGHTGSSPVMDCDYADFSKVYAASREDFEQIASDDFSVLQNGRTVGYSHFEVGERVEQIARELGIEILSVKNRREG